MIWCNVHACYKMSDTQRCVCMIMCAYTYAFKEFIAWHIEEIKIFYIFIFYFKLWTCVCVWDCLWVCIYEYRCLEKLKVPALTGVGVTGCRWLWGIKHRGWKLNMDLLQKQYKLFTNKPLLWTPRQFLLI